MCLISLFCDIYFAVSRRWGIGIDATNTVVIIAAYGEDCTKYFSVLQMNQFYNVTNMVKIETEHQCLPNTTTHYFKYAHTQITYKFAIL
jgi:hypothetical protein